MRQRIDAARCTVEYDNVGRSDGLAVLPFPHPGEDDGVIIYGSTDDLRAVVDAMAKLLDDLEDD